MPVTGAVSENADKTKNFHITGVNDAGTLHASMFAQGQRDKPDPMKPNAPSYSVAGISAGVATPAGSGVGLQTQRIPTFGNQITASTNLNVLKTDTHKLDVNAFTTNNIPKAGPNFSTHGAGIDYNFNDKIGANAAVSHTPMFKQTDYSLGGNVNLYRNPTTSLDFRAGANRTDTPFGSGNWNKQGSFQFTKKF